MAKKEIDDDADDSGEIRIDKWLWAVRVFKTRTLAADACKGNRVQIDGQSVKPSRPPRIGETIEVKKPPILHKYKVLGLIGKRGSATEAAKYCQDITPQEQYDHARALNQSQTVIRARGTGRPTKKERRNMEDWGLL